jgi:prefoldin subunit 5
MDLKESAMIRFENRVHTLATDPRELDREEDTLRRKLEDLRKEMMQLENNILFLSSSSSKESPIVVGVRKNIEKLARQVELLEDKIKLLRKQRREMDSRG